MKKILLSVVAAIMVSFTAMAQIPGNLNPGRMDMGNLKVIPRTDAVKSPDFIPGAMFANRASFRDCLYDTKDGYANAYGFLIFDYRYKTNALVGMTTDNPDSYDMIKNFYQRPAESYGFFCSTFVEDKLYGYCYQYYGPGAAVPISWGTIDPKTGDYTKICDLPYGYSIVFSDVTYDPETKMMYANSINYKNVEGQAVFEYTTIYQIDPKDPANGTKVVGKFDLEMYTLAVDRGNLYSIVPDYSMVGKLKGSHLVKFSIDKMLKGQPEIVDINKSKGLGFKIGYAQTMEFDKTNHKLWWIGQTMDDKSFFTEIDVEKGEIVNKFDYYMTTQIVALAIPYQYVAKNAPSYVRDLNVEVGKEGEPTVKFTWNNPENDYDLNPLTSLKDIKIFRDDKLIKTVPATGVGQPQSYEEGELTFGNHIYKIQTVNENGDGLYKEAKIFVGRDVPSKVSNIKLAVDGCKATITWNAPTIGLNGGFIDKSSLKYDVVRIPDNKVIGTDLTECIVVDEVSELKGYSYEITAKNKDGKGGVAVSEVKSFGPSISIPFFTTLDTQAEFDKWSVIDANNDMITWKYLDYANSTCYERSEGPANDYLVSPELVFDHNKRYQIRFTYWTINWVHPVTQEPIMDKMDVYYGQKPTKEGLNKQILDLGAFHTSSEEYLFAKAVFEPEDGVGHLAFHTYSDANKGIIYIKDVCVREYSATDLSITDLKGTIAAVQNVKSSFGVEVMNEGSATVENYTVDLINQATGEVLATSKGVPVKPEEKKFVTVDWAPQEVGEIMLTARVNLEGDTYIDDNTWSEPISITVAPAGSDNWLSVNKDEAHFDGDGNMYCMGYGMPFNCGKAYSMVQCIYLDKEITKKNISLTGIQFIYDGQCEGDFSKDIKISAMACDKDYFSWIPERLTSESYDYDDVNWIPVYKGKFNFSGISTNQKLIIEFDEPYYYEKGNLVFMFEKGWDDDYFTNNDAPAFHYDGIDGETDEVRQRTCMYKSNHSEIPDPDNIGTMPYVPFTLFQYKEGTQDGILGVSATGLNFDVIGGILTMSKVCDKVSVYDVNGSLVAQGKNTDKLNLGSKRGVYVIKAKAGKATINCKVTIK